jgi:hypothetical protein
MASLMELCKIIYQQVLYETAVVLCLCDIGKGLTRGVLSFIKRQSAIIFIGLIF